MPFHLQCPRCKFPFVMPVQADGMLFPCPNCGERIHVRPASAQSPVPRPFIPPSLPPLELLESYRRILGPRPFMLLDILGVYTEWSPEPTILEVFFFMGSLGFPATLLTLLILTVAYTANPDKAANAAPWFFGALLVGAVSAYAIAVHLAEREEPEPAPASLWLSRYFLDPLVLMVTERRAALPIYRLFTLALCLLIACLFITDRAGGLAYVVPAPVRTLPLFHPAPAPKAIATPIQPAPPPAFAPAEVFLNPLPPTPAPSPATPEKLVPQPTTRPTAWSPDDGPPPPPGAAPPSLPTAVIAAPDAPPTPPSPAPVTATYHPDDGPPPPPP